jgi:uncharacterized protein with PIN domain
MKFIVTGELGRLAKWLRILGFDTVYVTQINPGSLIIQALRDDRIILTRNHRLPKSAGARIMLLGSERIKEQLQEVLHKLRLQPQPETFFIRCTICNEFLERIDKGSVKTQVPEYVFKTQEDFLVCPKCSRVYWQGTHWGNVKETLDSIIH